MELSVRPGATVATGAALLIINGMIGPTAFEGTSFTAAKHSHHNACEGQSSCKSTTGCKGKGKYSA